MKPKVSIFVISLIFCFTILIQAEVPRLINYQGKLTHPDGAPVNNTIQMVFSIYADSVSGTSLWTETQLSVVVDNGIFNVLLGSVNEIPDSVFSGAIRYLGVGVSEILFF